ncbi:MAG: hypothetical protein V4649_18800 [Bacteroidota bacterium]
MENILYIILIVIQVGVVVFFIRKSRANAAKRKAISKDDVYTVFRKQAVSVTPGQLKIAIPNSETLVYGVVMDMDLGNAMVTVAAYLTGAASMYFSTGEGQSGGGKSPVVGEAAVDFVTAAQDYLDKARLVPAIEPPLKRSMRFYLLTNQHMYLLEEDLNRLETNSSQLAGLFQMGNEVIRRMHGNDNTAALN